MPADGTKNLIPQNQRTKAEQKKIAKLGGVASGEARRNKRDTAKIANQLLAMKVKSPEIKKDLQNQKNMIIYSCIKLF